MHKSREKQHGDIETIIKNTTELTLGKLLGIIPGGKKTDLERKQLNLFHIKKQFVQIEHQTVSRKHTRICIHYK